MWSLVRLFASNITGAPSDSANINLPGNTYTSGDLMHNLMSFAFFALGIVAIISLIIAGYQYLTANGDSQKAAKAIHNVLYSVIGLVVAIMAFAITQFVAGAFQ